MPVGDLIRKAKGAVGGVASTISDATASVAEAIPSRETVVKHIGHALIVGGKLLADPRAVVGELVVSLGTTLVAEQQEQWLVLEARDEGFVVIAKGAEVEARRAYEEAVGQGATVLLCEVSAASTST